MTRQDFENYRLMDKEVARLQQKMDYYLNNYPTVVHGVVQSSMSEYPYAQTHVVISGSDIKSTEQRDEKIRNLYIKLQTNKKRLEEAKIDVYSAIEDEQDLVMKQILDMKFVSGMTDSAIADELYLTRSAVTKRLTFYFKSE